VSSIFLEPVSMGNFGALAVAFGLSLDRARWRTAAAAVAIGLVVIVLADARFASAAALLFVIARLVPAGARPVIVALLPLAAIAVLIGFAFSDVGAGDDMPTRLAGSGRVLLGMSPAQVFALAPLDRTAFDSGYAYVFNTAGLPLCILLWAVFVYLPAPSPEAQRYKLLLALYVCALLCISGSSLFALKTSALAFFTYGAFAAPALAVHLAQRPAPAAPLAAVT
jgi:putative polymerase